MRVRIRRRKVIGSDQQVRSMHDDRSWRLVLNESYRHCFQTAATKGVAAYPDSEDGAADSLHHRHSFRSHRRSFDLGLVTSNPRWIYMHV